jgi:hypothetical protein
MDVERAAPGWGGVRGLESRPRDHVNYSIIRVYARSWRRFGLVPPVRASMAHTEERAGGVEGDARTGTVISCTTIPHPPEDAKLNDPAPAEKQGDRAFFSRRRSWHTVTARVTRLVFRRAPRVGDGAGVIVSRGSGRRHARRRVRRRGRRTRAWAARSSRYTVLAPAVRVHDCRSPASGSQAPPAAPGPSARRSDRWSHAPGRHASSRNDPPAPLI